MKKFLFIMLFSISTGLFLIAQPPSPIAWYPFNGNANDAVGTVHGSVTGATLTQDRFGNPNSAYYFDGDYDFINLGNTDYIRPKNAITICGWFTYEYPENIGKNGRALISCTEQGGYNMIYEYDSRAFPFRFQLNGHYQPIYSFKDTILSGWHHFAATFDGSKAILYMDGKYRGKYNCWSGCEVQYSHYDVNTYIGVDATSPYEIPGHYFDPVSFWKGKIDEVKIFNVALTGQQVLDEYNRPNVPQNTWYFDADKDGFGNTNKEIYAISCPKGYVATPGDCRDWDSLFYPGAPELCDGEDNDCDGQVDDGLPGTKWWYRDYDLDGFGNPNIKKQSCIPPPGYVPNSDDCNDVNSTIYKGAHELCDGKDNDCDGVVDDGTYLIKWYRDYDRDGFGGKRIIKYSCVQPHGYVAFNGDCNDYNPDFNPGASELPDGMDNDCDGQTDEGLICVKLFYRDVDRDGYGNKESAVVLYSCVPPVGYADNNLDCKDRDATVYPGAPELCDGKDNDCDGEVDEGWKGTRIWYWDNDGDGYGNSKYTKQSCIKPLGYVDNSFDCKDWDANVYPGHGCPPIPGGLIVTNTTPKAMAEAAAEILIFPNPARTEINVTLNGFEAGQKVELALVQIDGKVVSTQSLIPYRMGQQVRVDVRSMNTGYYLLQVKQGALQQTKKVMIVK
jgi:Concanavalin A-like lectin/glucanases superfamily/Putative metal-binding motif/Secretion system C-terminal sorting domain